MVSERKVAIVGYSLGKVMSMIKNHCQFWVYNKTKLALEMERQKEHQPHHKQNNRRRHMNKIRQSLKDFNLISQNKRMVESKLSLHYDSLSESDSQDGFSMEAEDNTRQSSFEHAELFAEKYQNVGKLGEGSDGVVRRCIKKRSGVQYAAKSFMFEDQHLPQLRYNFLLVKNLNHRNVIQYEALYLDLKKHLCWLVMELVEAPNLARTIIQSQTQLRDIIQQLLQTLHYLHQRSITHRDVKAQNILYDFKTKKFKLIDFGICRKHRRRGIRIDMLTITGTLYYRAPEMFNGGGYNQKVDIWSTGILIYKLITGRTPFESVYHSQTINNILNGDIEFPQAFSKFSPALRGLISKMLKKNPKERFSALDCLKDPWFYVNSTNYTLPYQVHYCDELNEEENECLQGFKSPMLNILEQGTYIRKINGNEYHCFDSDDENMEARKIGLKRHAKSLLVDLHSFKI